MWSRIMLKSLAALVATTGGVVLECRDPNNCTSTVQAALDDASIASIVIPDANGSAWQVEPLFLTRDDVALTLAPGAALEAAAGSYKGTNDCLLTVSTCRNVTIVARGATLRMRRP